MMRGEPDVSNEDLRKEIYRLKEVMVLLHKFHTWIGIAIALYLFAVSFGVTIIVAYGSIAPPWLTRPYSFYLTIIILYVFAGVFCEYRAVIIKNELRRRYGIE